MTYDESKAKVFELLVPQVGSNVRMDRTLWTVTGVDFGFAAITGGGNSCEVLLDSVWAWNKSLSRDWVLSGPHQADTLAGKSLETKWCRWAVGGVSLGLEPNGGGWEQ